MKDIELIATFDGGKIIGTVDELNYHESWDRLFPVIDKINGLGKGYNFAIFKTYVSLSVEKVGNKFYKDFSFSHAEYITENQTGIEATFKLIVKFLKWYNENGIIDLDNSK